MININFDKELKNEVDSIYNIFKSYEVDADINFEQEYGGDIKKRLIESSVRDINFFDIKDYLGSPKRSYYSDNEVKHFTPRLIDFFIKGENPSIIEIDVFKILNNVSFWKREELNQLSEIASKYFYTFIENKYYIDIVDVFYIFRFDFFNFNNFFKIWIKFNDIKSLIAYSTMLEKNKYFEGEGEGEGEDDDCIRSEIRKWAFSEKVIIHFEEIIYNKFIDKVDEYDDLTQKNIDYLIYIFNKNK